MTDEPVTAPLQRPDALYAKFDVRRLKDGSRPDFAFVLTDQDPRTPRMLEHYASLVDRFEPGFADDLRSAAQRLECLPLGGKPSDFLAILPDEPATSDNLRALAHEAARRLLAAGSPRNRNPMRSMLSAGTALSHAWWTVRTVEVLADSPIRRMVALDPNDREVEITVTSTPNGAEVAVRRPTIGPRSAYRHAARGEELEYEGTYTDVESLEAVLRPGPAFFEADSVTPAPAPTGAPAPDEDR